MKIKAINDASLAYLALFLCNLSFKLFLELRNLILRNIQSTEVRESLKKMRCHTILGGLRGSRNLSSTPVKILETISLRCQASRF